VPTKLLLSDFFEDTKSKGTKVEAEILALIAHRMNIPNSWQHITPESVKEAQRKRELDKIRQKTKEAGDLQRYIELLEEDNYQKQTEIENLHFEINDLQNNNDYYFSEYEKESEERKAQQFKVESLKSQFEVLKITRQKRGELEDCSGELRLLFEEYLKEKISPCRCLELISRLYPDRIIVLDSAYKSSRDSQGFIEKKIVFDLLWKLSTDYWEALDSGRGDTEARQIFGNDYAAKESDTVEKNKETKRSRTFSYNGVEIEMMKHLKHGRKDSPAETIRIHFEWESDEKKIIIGYCGPHLDLV
jgi:hypothetical protein